MAELVDASDLKSLDPKGSCRFESGRGHQSHCRQGRKTFMFEMEKDERIRGLDANTAALSMALAHDFVLEILLTREMIEKDAAEAQKLARVMVERWQRRYGQSLGDDFTKAEDGDKVLHATKAFVDRLARKALKRSVYARELQAASMREDTSL